MAGDSNPGRKGRAHGGACSHPASRSGSLTREAAEPGM
jgi:hypothetical protein